MPEWIPKLSARVIAMVVGVIVLIAAVGLFVRSCDARRSRAAQTRMDNAQAEGRVKSEGEALNTIGNNADRADQIDQTVKEGSNEVRSAPGSDAKVDPRSRDAARRAACKLRSYRDSDECRAMLGAHPS
jgi:hypothetical protein